MSHRLRVGAWVCAAAAALALATGTASGELELTAGVLEADSTSTCILLHHPSSGELFLLENYWDFAIGDTVVVIHRSAEYRNCSSSDTYLCLLDNRIESNRDFHLGCGWLELRPPCFYLVHELFSGTFLLDGPLDPLYPSPGTFITVVGTVDLRCGAAPGCEADVCLRELWVVECPEPAAVGTTWGSVKAAFGP